MAEDWPGSIYGVPVRRAPLGANRSDGNVLPKTIAIVHDIEGGASSALGLFASPGDPKEGGGSATFVADPDSGCFWQLMGADSAVAYGCGNYDYNRRAIQIELPGVAGTPYDAQVLDYCARWLAWANYTHGIPLTRLTLSALNGGALSGVTGHQDIPDPNNPKLGGGKDHHGDPGPTFPWDNVLASARKYAGSPPLNPVPVPRTNPDAGDADPGSIGSYVWPTGYRVGGSFLRAFATIAGTQPTYTAGNLAAAVAIFGYPVGRQFVDEGATPHLIVQYFERARMEKHPDGTITLGRLGAEMWPDRAVFLPPVASQREG